MKITTKRTAIVSAIISVMAIVIGILLIPVVTVPATVIITLAALALIYSLYNLIKIVLAEKEAEEYEDYEENEDEDRARTVSEKKGIKFDAKLLVLILIFLSILVLVFQTCSGQPVLYVDRIETPELDVTGTVTTPKMDVTEEIKTPELNVEDKITTPELDVTEEITTPELNITEEIVTPKLDVTEEIKTPEINVTEEITTPKLDVANGGVTCNPQPAKPVETPKVETPKTEPIVHVCAVAKTDVVNATCTKAGYTREICSCGKILSDNAIKATGHNWDNGKVTKPATEKTTGIKTYTCKTCGETNLERLDKLEHVCELFDVIEKEATCEENGYIREVCSCGKVLSDMTVKATGHSWNKGKVTKEPTENAIGKKTYTCKNCGETKTEKLDKLEHVCKACDVIEKEATCTKAGYIRKVCSCGEVLSDTTVKATGHDYKEVERKEATSTVDGYIKYRCSNCRDTYEDVIPATGEVEEPVDDEFVIAVNKMKVVGNEFDAIEVYTSGNANDLVVLQNQKVFNYTVKDSHHLILTVGDVDTFAKVRIYDPAHEDKVVEVLRLSPVDPRA